MQTCSTPREGNFSSLSHEQSCSVDDGATEGHICNGKEDYSFKFGIPKKS